MKNIGPSMMMLAGVILIMATLLPEQHKVVLVHGHTNPEPSKTVSILAGGVIYKKEASADISFYLVTNHYLKTITVLADPGSKKPNIKLPVTMEHPLSLGTQTFVSVVSVSVRDILNNVQPISDGNTNYFFTKLFVGFDQPAGAYPAEGYPNYREIEIECSSNKCQVIGSKDTF